jgi:hypothetical protein
MTAILNITSDIFTYDEYFRFKIKFNSGSYIKYCKHTTCDNKKEFYVKFMLKGNDIKLHPIYNKFSQDVCKIGSDQVIDTNNESFHRTLNAFRNAHIRGYKQFIIDFINHKCDENWLIDYFCGYNF